MVSLFYEKVMEEYDLVPIAIAYEPSNPGKSKAAKLSVAECGNPSGVYTDITSAAARQMLVTGAPFVLDDPDDPTLVREILIGTVQVTQTH